MWLGNVDADGILQCTTDPVASDSTFVGGIAINTAGATHITETVSTLFSNGFMVSATGQLVVDIDGIIDEYLMGLPRTAEGALVVQSGSPLSSDPFVSGICVGNAGGMFIVGGAVAWTPAELFASGEVGVWYDPSDLTTMFQDSAGTTPVTATGQPVGLILDKSKGLVLGSELITNGTFDADTTGWIVTSTALIDAVAGVARVTVGTPIDALEDRIATYTLSGLTVGVSYKAQATLYAGTSSARLSVTSVRAGGDTTGVYVDNSTPTPTDKQIIFTATATTMYVRLICIEGAAGLTAYFDNISVKELSGKHASQATAASRPIYRDVGGYQYLEFDGVDDSLATAAIDFSATDKMSIFTGVYHNSTTNYRIILELGAFYTDDYVVSLWARFATEEWLSSIGNSGDSIKIFNPRTVPSTSVLTALYDNSLDSVAGYSLIENTDITGVTKQGVPPGIGNFLNTPLYIGARTVQTAGFIVGNIYSLIVRGAQSTAGEITDTETWVNGKTGAY